MTELEQIVSDIKNAASGVVGKDVEQLRGFTERQIKAIGEQTLLVANGILTGDISEDTRDFFLDSLEDMALNLAKTLRGMVMVTIEKVWNAIVKVLYDAISRISGIELISP